MKTIKLFEEFENVSTSFMGIKGLEKTTPCKIGQPLTEREKSFVKIGPSFFKRVNKDDNYYYCGEFRCEDIKLLPLVIFFGHDTSEEAIFDEDGVEIWAMYDKFKVTKDDKELTFDNPNDLMTCLFLFDMIWALQDMGCVLDETDILEIVEYNIEPVKYLERSEVIDELYVYCKGNDYERCLHLFKKNEMYFNS